VALPEIIDAMYRDERMDLVTHENALGDTMEQNELRRFQVRASGWACATKPGWGEEVHTGWLGVAASHLGGTTHSGCNASQSYLWSLSNGGGAGNTAPCLYTSAARSHSFPASPPVPTYLAITPPPSLSTTGHVPGAGAAHLHQERQS
jgi:hypothetical protein